MSVPPEVAVRTGYFRLRVRTHEWAERQRVSLLDVRGLGKVYLRMLYACGLSTADEIMSTPTAEIVARLAPHANFPKSPTAAAQTLLGWKAQILALWQAKSADPPPPGWIQEP